MAKLNSVRLLGYSVGKPEVVNKAVIIDNERKIKSSLELELNVYKRSKGQLKTNLINIESREEDVIKKPLFFEQMMMVDGYFCEKKIRKKLYCNICQSDYFVEKLKYYVYAKNILPLQIERDTQRQSDFLLENASISNDVILEGYIVRKISEYTINTYTYSNFIFAVKRGFNIPESVKTVDYLICSVRNLPAEAFLLHTEVGSLCLLRGYLSNRVYDKIYKCPHCGSTHTIKETIIEMNAISIEYESEMQIDGEKDKIQDTIKIISSDLGGKNEQ